MLRGRGAGQPLLHRRDLRLVRDNVSNVTDDRIYTYQKATHYPWITIAMFVPLVVTMTEYPPMPCDVASLFPWCSYHDSATRGLLAIMTQSVVTLSPAQCPLNTNFALCSCNKMFVSIHFNRIMLNCEMYKLKSILCIAMVVCIIDATWYLKMSS